MTLLQQDKARKGSRPIYQILFRLAQQTKNTTLRKILSRLCTYSGYIYHTHISASPRIGGGLCIGHPCNITINGDVVIGKNCNLQKNVTIGQANRGKRKGCPTIGNKVWIGINATIVGKITIGDDVLIAPNSYVNIDVPSHSVVIGNPCQIHHRENATDGYIINPIDE